MYQSQSQSTWRVGGALITAVLCGSVAWAGPPDMHDVTSRGIVGAPVTFLDAQAGNGWQRTDTVGNTSGSWTVVIDSIDFNVLDPEDLGFDDIFGTTTNPPTNVPQVLAAGASAFPAYHPAWGACWYPSVDTFEVDWVSGEVINPPLPIVLGPGESVQIVTRMHNSVQGPVFNNFNDYGEVVIGFQFNGAVVPAGDPEGACCLDDGSCADVSDAGCTALAGAYMGDGSDCASAVCGLSGACCFDDGSCTEVSETDCGDQGGDYQGDASTCNPCPQPGACCFQTGDCQELFEAECTSQNGFFQGEASLCLDDPCCPGDIDGDGVTQIGDLIEIIFEWNCGTKFGDPPPCLADVTGDGITNVDDLVFVVQNWNCGFVPP